MSLLQQQQQQQQNSNEKRPTTNLLQRNSSQLLQHATRISGLRRSLTTKVSTSPQVQRPRTSTSTHSSSHYKKSTNQQTLQLKEYIPPPPLTDDIFSSIGSVEG
jgi:hypothetical protein